MSNAKPQFNLQPITPKDVNGQGRRGGVWITLDKQGRLSLSSEYRNKLGIRGFSAPVYIAVDPAQMVIALVKQDVTRTVANAASMKVNRDGYVYGGAVFEKLALKKSDGPYRFEFLGAIDHDGTRWDGFRLNTE